MWPFTKKKTTHVPEQEGQFVVQIDDSHDSLWEDLLITEERFSFFKGEIARAVEQCKTWPEVINQVTKLATHANEVFLIGWLCSETYHLSDRHRKMRDFFNNLKS